MTWSQAREGVSAPCPAQNPVRSSSAGRQELGEAELVAIGIADVEVAFAPGSVPGFVRAQSRLDLRPVFHVSFVDPKDGPPPPTAFVALRLNEIHEGLAYLETGEGCLLPINY